MKPEDIEALRDIYADEVASSVWHPWLPFTRWLQSRAGCSPNQQLRIMGGEWVKANGWRSTISPQFLVQQRIKGGRDLEQLLEREGLVPPSDLFLCELIKEAGGYAKISAWLEDNLTEDFTRHYAAYTLRDVAALVERETGHRPSKFGIASRRRALGVSSPRGGALRSGKKLPAWNKWRYLRGGEYGPSPLESATPAFDAEQILNRATARYLADQRKGE